MPVTAYGEFADVSDPVVSSSSPLAIVKPGVDVAKVTVPTEPDAALSMLVKVPLLSLLVKPDPGGPCVIVSGVTVSE